MSTLSHEAREVLRRRAADTISVCVESADIRVLLADSDALAAAERERDEAIGIGPGSNDGPFLRCECGRRMVWQYPVNVAAGEPGAPAWTCPNCVTRRLRKAEALVAALREALERALFAVDHAAENGGPSFLGFVLHADRIRHALLASTAPAATPAPETEGGRP